MPKLVHLIEYFTGPVILSTVVGIALLGLAFLGRDPEGSPLIPILIALCGLLAIFAGVWAGVQKTGKLNTIRRAVATQVGHIIYLSELQFSQMAIAARKIELRRTKSPSEEEVLSVFASLAPLGNSVLVSAQNNRTLNWLEFMEQYSLMTLNKIEEIQKYMPFLEPELVELLGRLSDCYHFKEVRVTRAMPPGNQDLSYAAGFFSNYQSIVSEIREYFNRNLKSLSSSSPPMGMVVPVTPDQ